MKKLVSGMLVLLSVAAAAFFIAKAFRFTPERSRATELAPGETILFVHTPDLQETARRFRKTSLFAIWQEPEVQEFMQKPRKTAPIVRQWEERLARLARLAPGEAFLAITSMDGPQPRFVAGFSFAGRRREVEGLLAEPREEFKRRWPAGTSSSASHKGAAIEVFTYPDGLLAESFVRNWYFVSSDTTLLRATLDRYESAAPAAADALTGNEVFQKATTPLGGGSDVVLFAQTAALGGRVNALMPAAKLPTNPKQSADTTKAQAVAAATRIDGTQMRDTVFILSPREANEPPLSRSSLALSGPETFLYFAMGIASLTQLPESVGTLASALPGVSAMEAALAERKLAWSDFGAAFGPEMGTTMGWPEDMAMPAILLGIEVRDLVKARGFVEAVTGGLAGAPAWARRENSGATYFSAPAEDAALASPVIAITPRFALLGFSAEAVAGGVAKMNAADGDGAVDSPFEEAAKRLANPTSGFGYLDAGVLFERAYRTLRPALTMSLAFSGDLGDYLDAGKLPPAETISRHLSPSVFSQSATPNGVLMESAGTLTFNQLLLGMIAGATTVFPADEATSEAPGEEVQPASISTTKPNVDDELVKPVVAAPVDAARSEVEPAKALDTAIPAR